MSIIGLAILTSGSLLGISVFVFLWIQKTKQLKKLEEDRDIIGLNEEIIKKIKDYSGGINGLLKAAEEVQELEKYKKFGTPEDFENLKQLKDDCLCIGLDRNEVVNLRNEKIIIPAIISEQKRLESELKQKNQTIFDLGQEIEKRNYESSNWGFTDSLRDSLKNKKIDNIRVLLEKFEELEKKLLRWQELADNVALEVAEENKRKSREKVEKKRGLSRDIRETGSTFENWFYKGFKLVFGTYNSEVNCSPQDNHSDFLISFDSENSSCRVVVECKSTMDYEEDLYSLSFSEEDTEKRSKKKKEQLEKGIKQIKQYLKKHDAQIGILLTSFDFEQEYEEIKRDSKDNIDFPLLVVKDDIVFYYLSLIYFVNKYSVPVEKPTIDMENFKDKEYELIPFLREIIIHLKELQKHHSKTLKKAQEIHKNSELFNKYSAELKKCLDLLISRVDRKQGLIDLLEEKETLSLDSSVEVSEEENDSD